MNSYIAIQEENKIYSWLPIPNEQYNQPPVGAICWVSGESNEELLSEARNKFIELGFEIVSIDFYSPGPGDKPIHLIVKERADTESIEVGSSKLVRSDVTKGWIAH